MANNLLRAFIHRDCLHSLHLVEWGGWYQHLPCLQAGWQSNLGNLSRWTPWSVVCISFGLQPPGFESFPALRCFLACFPFRSVVVSLDVLDLDFRAMTESGSTSPRSQHENRAHREVSGTAERSRGTQILRTSMSGSRALVDIHGHYIRLHGT